MNTRGNILVVDDTKANLRLLTEMLTEEGFTVRPAPSGAIALKAVSTYLPELILLDINMPGMNGFEVCEKLKADEQSKDIPVIFISALNETLDKVRAFSVGGVDYITKPFQFEEVLARVKTHLSLHRLQQELQQNNEALITSNKELEAFSHTVAHDLKNPVSSIIGFAQLLNIAYSELNEDDIKSILVSVETSANKANRIIEELLLLSSTRSQTVEATPVNMADILIEVEQSLSSMIEEYQAEIILPDEWPIVEGYAPWIEEIWMNYVTNAMKYGGRPPRVELGATIQDDGWIRFWVRDNGRGLSPENQAKLFNEFTRLGEVEVEGTGLGLSIVRRIAKKLGGTAGVESEIGQGSLFFFTLPST
jgi:signal transduction histidine kinase